MQIETEAKLRHLRADLREILNEGKKVEQEYVFDHLLDETKKMKHQPQRHFTEPKAKEFQKPKKIKERLINDVNDIEQVHYQILKQNKKQFSTDKPIETPAFYPELPSQIHQVAYIKTIGQQTAKTSPCRSVSQLFT